MTVLLTRLAVLQAAIETTYNTPVALGVGDGFLVSDPKFSLKPNVLERNFVRQDLSPEPIIIGRKIASIEFTTELRGNGLQNSGLIGNAPVIARLFQACGYALAASATPSAFGPYIVGDAPTPIAWTPAAGSATNTDVIAYYLTVTTPGISGTAKITVTSDTTGEGSAAAFVTTATAIDLGTKGLTLTPVFTGSLVAGQQWVIWLMPPGLSLTPISNAFQSITMALHMDNVLHSMPGAFGTFEITAQAGNFAMVKWTFTGTYVEPTDDANPSPTFETTLPSQVQLARLTVSQFQAIVEKFTFNQGNDIQIRPSVSASDGYVGVRITARKPEGGIDPEADTVADNDFWGQFSAALRMPFQMRVGSVAGNTVWVIAPNTQYSGMTYQDRNGILTYDAGLRFSRSVGNDEIAFFFC